MLIKSSAEVIQLKPPQQSQFVVQFVLPHIFGVKWFIVLGIYPRKVRSVVVGNNGDSRFV